SEKENKRIESELIQLIDYCEQEGIHIAILGDLFDYWMEYPDKIPTIGKDLLARFYDFNQKMGPSLYITGNHDNWTHRHFQNSGFYVEHEHYFCSLNDSKVMLLHGDGLSDRNQQLPR